MKKFLLVVFIGMVLGMSIFAAIDDYMNGEVEEVDHIKESTIAVYME